MMPGSDRNARFTVALAFCFSTLQLAALPSAVSAGPVALHAIADVSPEAGAESDSDADRPAQREPDTDEPSEDGTDGARGGNAGEPPAGCLFRDGPLELVV